MVNNTIRKYLLIMACAIAIHSVASSCAVVKPFEPNRYKADSDNIYYSGRIDFSNPGIARLSGAGSYLKFSFIGSFCDIILSDQNLHNGYGFISIEVDGIYKERIKITKNMKLYRIVEIFEETRHEVLICKANEVANGYIDVEAIICNELLPSENIHKRKIEFIGNSITCGMGNDESGLPCGEGLWYDQHNAYWSYAPIAARALNSEWLLSSVSGIGIYRNWNSPAPVMPDVYNNLFLNTDSSVTWPSDRFDADLISICLGTNDFSNGDGSYDRGPVDSAKYVGAYINFIEYLRTRNADAPIVCLTSAMIAGKLGERMKSFIEAVVSQLETKGYKEIYMFTFTGGSFNAGCSGHPDIDEHKEIARQVIPFYKQVMNW